jgi:hypothetical protein
MCCLCHALGVEAHHIIAEAEGGPDSEENAAPLCPSCHETYGANPDKRKFIRDARDFLYELCDRRYEWNGDQMGQILAIESFFSAPQLKRDPLAAAQPRAHSPRNGSRDLCVACVWRSRRSSLPASSFTLRPRMLSFHRVRSQVFPFGRIALYAR